MVATFVFLPCARKKTRMPRKREWQNVRITSILLYVFHLITEQPSYVWLLKKSRIAFIAYRIVNADTCKRRVADAISRLKVRVPNENAHVRGTKKERWQTFIYFVHLTNLGNEGHEWKWQSRWIKERKMRKLLAAWLSCFFTAFSEKVCKKYIFTLTQK